MAEATVDIRAPKNASATGQVYDRWYTDKRIVGLTTFAIAISILTIAGHVFLGFEQSWITPFVALATTYAVDLVGETLDARAEGRAPSFAGSLRNLVVFLLPAHITALAVSMLLYASDQLWAVVFASSLAIASKFLCRLPRIPRIPNLPTHSHYLNPSNLGIAATLLLFPNVGIAPPYQFSENTSGALDWLLPLIIVCTGSFLNIKATNRHILIVSWLAAFLAQGLVRAMIHATPWNAGLEPMTGFAFILFTFYMVTDPGTTPSKPREQILFGAAVGVTYGVLMEFHVVFGLFFALAVVSSGRALLILAARSRASHARQ